MPLLTYKKPVSFLRVPVDTKGKLFASPMPFGPYDPFNRLLKYYKQSRVKTVVILTTPSEIELKARKDIRAIYLKHGMQFIHCPIGDFTAPTVEVLAPLIDQVVVRLQTENVAVHCNAGVGRTGVVLACVLSRVEGILPEDAFTRLQQLMQIRTTDEQRRLATRWFESLQLPA
jgi:protein-tyrosine phosphatase